jgi:REP element-mobilizing transposase RayT
LRGNHREDLFATADDRYKLNGIIAQVLERYQARAHAFCWMTNHLHLLAQIGDVPLAKVMQLIAQRYARYRHKQLTTTGHLFERRYKAWLVDTNAYFVALIRYIHRNPIRADMVANLDEYPWSSHRSYSGLESYSWLCVDFGLGLLGATVNSARRAYRTLINQEDFASEDRLFDDVHPDDPRVLGGDAFLHSLSPPRVLTRSRLTLDELIEQVCKQHDVPTAAVLSTSKHRRVVDARVEIAVRARDERIATVTCVARKLGRSHAAMSQLLKRRASA